MSALVYNMRNSKDVFHLAIPCKDVGETVEFYENNNGL